VSEQRTLSNSLDNLLLFVLVVGLQVLVKLLFPLHLFFYSFPGNLNIICFTPDGFHPFWEQISSLLLHLLSLVLFYFLLHVSIVFLLAAVVHQIFVIPCTIMLHWRRSQYLLKLPINLGYFRFLCFILLRVQAAIICRFHIDAGQICLVGNGGSKLFLLLDEFILKVLMQPFEVRHILCSELLE
jgi:hypothetical protein